MIAVPAFQFQQQCEKMAREVDETSSDDATSNSSPSSPMEQVPENDSHAKTVSSHAAGRRQIYYCTIKPCDYESDRKNNLKRHILAMHTESTKVFTCCDHKFSCKAEFRRHTRQVHRSSGYTCDQCGLRFDRRALLLRHKSVHSGVKPFKCSCGYATSHKSNLLRHCAKLGHKSKDTNFTPRSSLSSHGEAYSSDASSKSGKNLNNGEASATPGRKRKMNAQGRSMRSLKLSPQQQHLCSPSPPKKDRSFVSSTTEDVPEDSLRSPAAVLPQTRVPSFLFESPPSSMFSYSYPLNELRQSNSVYPKAKQAWARAYYLQQQGIGQTHKVPTSIVPPNQLNYTTYETSDHVYNNNDWNLPQHRQLEIKHCTADKNRMRLPLKVPALGIGSLDKCAQCNKNGGLFTSYMEPFGCHTGTRGDNTSPTQEHSSLSFPMIATPLADNHSGFSPSRPFLSTRPYSYGPANISQGRYPSTAPSSNPLSLVDPTYDCDGSTNYNRLSLGTNGSGSNGSESITRNDQNQNGCHYPSASPMRYQNGITTYNHNSNDSYGTYNSSEHVAESDIKHNSLLSICTPFQPWYRRVSINPYFHGHCDAEHHSFPREPRNRNSVNMSTKANNGHECTISKNHTKDSLSQSTTLIEDNRVPFSCKQEEEEDHPHQGTAEGDRFPKHLSPQPARSYEENLGEPSVAIGNTDSPSTSSQSLASTISSSNDDMSPLPLKKETWRSIRPRICFAPYKCFECGISFALQADYNEHEQKHPHQKQVMMSIVAVMNKVRISPKAAAEKNGHCSSEEHEDAQSA